MYQGWTRDIPQDRKLQNALESALQLLAADPANPYWQACLELAERQLLQFHAVSARPAELVIFMPAYMGV